MEGPTARPAQPDVHEQAAEPPQPVQGPTARPTVQAAKTPPEGPLQPGNTLNEPARRDPVAPAAPSSASQNHEDEKTVLIVCGVAVGLLALGFFHEQQTADCNNDSQHVFGQPARSFCEKV